MSHLLSPSAGDYEVWHPKTMYEMILWYAWRMSADMLPMLCNITTNLINNDTARNLNILFKVMDHSRNAYVFTVLNDHRYHWFHADLANPVVSNWPFAVKCDINLLSRCSVSMHFSEYYCHSEMEQAYWRWTSTPRCRGELLHIIVFFCHFLIPIFYMFYIYGLCEILYFVHAYIIIYVGIMYIPTFTSHRKPYIK